MSVRWQKWRLKILAFVLELVCCDEEHLVHFEPRVGVWLKESRQECHVMNLWRLVSSPFWFDDWFEPSRSWVVFLNLNVAFGCPVWSGSLHERRMHRAQGLTD